MYAFVPEKTLRLVYGTFNLAIFSRLGDFLRSREILVSYTGLLQNHWALKSSVRSLSQELQMEVYLGVVEYKVLADWRHSLVFDYIKGDVLDIGCGNSIILQKFGTLIDSYYGVELSTKRFAGLLKKFPTARFLARNLDKEPLRIDKRFDLVLMIAIIEHIWNQKFLIEQLVGLLKSDGKIIITTPTPFGNDIIHTAGAKMGLFAKSAVDDHVVIYNRRRFENLAREFDLKILRYKRFQLFCNQFVVLGKNGSPPAGA